MSVLDAAEQNHQRAAQIWRDLLRRDEHLITTNYVLVALFALAQRRLGLAAVRTIDSDIVPAIDVIWIDADTHARAVSMLLHDSRRKLSLVDCASFEVMRRSGVQNAFAIDSDFADHGFNTVP